MARAYRIITGVGAGVGAGVSAGVSTSMGSSGRMRAGVITSHGVVGVVNAVTGQGVMSVVGVATKTSTSGTSSAVPSTMLLMATEFAVILDSKPKHKYHNTARKMTKTYGAAGDRVGSRRRVRSSFVTSQRVVGVRNTVASERVVGVVGVGASAGGVGSGVIAGNRIVGVIGAVAGQGIMSVVRVVSIVTKGSAGAGVAGSAVTDTVLLIPAKLTILLQIEHDSEQEHTTC